MRRAAAADEVLVDAAARGVVGDRHAPELLDHGLPAGRVLGQELAVEQFLLDDRAAQRREAERVGARPHAQVEVGHLGGLGPDRVEHDHRAAGVAGDLAQRDAGAREALRLPGVLADEDEDLGVLHVAAGVAAVEAGVDVELAGLLLRERARAKARAERAQDRAAVGPAEMVALAAAAVIEDRLSAVLVTYRCEPLRDLGDRGVPVDLLEAAVLAPAQRRGQAVTAVLVVVEPEGLVAGVPLRCRVGLVAADLLERAPLELDLDPAVALAQDAGGLLPLAGRMWLLRAGARRTSSWPGQGTYYAGRHSQALAAIPSPGRAHDRRMSPRRRLSLIPRG